MAFPLTALYNEKESFPSDTLMHCFLQGQKKRKEDRSENNESGGGR
jgi:hypothetical protein